MKITFVVLHTPETVGYASAEEFLKYADYHNQYCERLERRGHSVELFLMHKNPTEVIQQEPYFIKAFSTSIGGRYGSEYSRGLVNYLKRRNRDIIHLHGCHQLNIVPMVFQLRDSHSKIVIQYHGSPPNRNKFHVRLWDQFLKRTVFAITDHIITVNKSEADILRDVLPRNNISHLPTGVDTELFKPMDKEKCRNKLDLAVNKRYLLFVGRLVFSKGVRYLVESLDDFSSEDVHLILIYSGTESAELDKINEIIENRDLNDRVHFVGAVNHNRLPVYYNSADIFVLPSFDEGWGAVVMEAMACNTPVVATENLKGTGLTIDHETCLLTEPQSSKGIKQCVEELLSDEELRSNITNRAYDNVNENFDWNEITHKLESIYSDTS